MDTIIGYLAAGLVGLGIATFAVGLARRTSTGVEALTRVGVVPPPAPASDGSPRTSEDPLTTRLAALGRRFTARGEGVPRDRAAKVRTRLDRAGLAMPAEALVALKVGGLGAGLLLGLLATLVLGTSLLVGVVLLAALAVAGFMVPDLYVLNTAQRRQQQITRSIPETLDLLALTAQAGLGLEQGIAEVTSAGAAVMPGALGAELDRFLKEQQLGLGRQAALQGLMERNSSEDLRSLAQALLQADQLGTPVAATLQVQAREMRRRRRARARERAGKAPVKLLFPLIFGIFPALFVIIMGPGAISIIRALG